MVSEFPALAMNGVVQYVAYGSGAATFSLDGVVSSGHEHPGNAVGSAAAVTAAWTPPPPDSGAGAASPAS